ncbi:MAG: Hpt domain-containing protein [Spirochaetaceae bacterium]|nr:Hpt domain-containing protein [Spirochaetaceae bacterium]MDT8296807.1 Hpt domain-containing protein [Spirochaetaceae bacterium]
MKKTQELRVDASRYRGYLEVMFLLSEVADKILNEIQSWPSGLNTKVTIRCAHTVNDARAGSERTLVELIMIPFAYPIDQYGKFDVSIQGSEDEVQIVIGNAHAEGLEAALRKKAGDWNPRVLKRASSITMILDIPSAMPDPPADLNAMARETGIGLPEARLIMDGFIRNAKVNMDVIRRGSSTDEMREAQYRAAHSLKGAGKTLRAPELAAAARAVENRIRYSHSAGCSEIQRLEDAWLRIERWFEEGTR